MYSEDTTEQFKQNIIRGTQAYKKVLATFVSYPCQWKVNGNFTKLPESQL